MIRIALASNDGNLVDQHFGYARYFTIADLYEDSYQIIESRTVSSEYAAFGCGECGNHPAAGEVAMEQKFAGTMKVLSDCKAVFVTHIGSGAAYYLLKNGIRVFQVFGTVDEIVNHVIENKLLKEGEEG